MTATQTGVPGLADGLSPEMTVPDLQQRVLEQYRGAAAATQMAVEIDRALTVVTERMRAEGAETLGDVDWTQA